MSVAEVRAYELSLLRVRELTKEDGPREECGKDLRKGVSETFCGRKSSGCLIAVMPCLQIGSIRPMFASESLTEVMLFLWFLLEIFPGLQHVVYDFVFSQLQVFISATVPPHVIFPSKFRVFVGASLKGATNMVVDPMKW